MEPDGPIVECSIRFFVMLIVEPPTLAGSRHNHSVLRHLGGISSERVGVLNWAS